MKYHHLPPVREDRVHASVPPPSPSSEFAEYEVCVLPGMCRQYAGLVGSYDVQVGPRVSCPSSHTPELPLFPDAYFASDPVGSRG